LALVAECVLDVAQSTKAAAGTQHGTVRRGTNTSGIATGAVWAMSATTAGGGSLLARAAWEYARRGVPVFPCVPWGKEPLTGHGYREASTDLRRVSSWWRWQPKANIGIPTGAVRGAWDVLDVDVHAGGDGFAALAAVRGAGLLEGWERIVRSPSGGLHLYFPANGDPRQRSWSVPGSHVDFLANGRYVMAPPSVRRGDGVVLRYEELAAGRVPAPAEGWRMEATLRPPQRAASGHGTVGGRRGPAGDADTRRMIAWLGTQQEGGRNRALFWVACRLTESGAARSEATLGALKDAALRVGLAEREIDRTIASALRSAAPAAGRGPGGGTFQSAGASPGASL
jgi:hypothetical protein